jgi:hypothetical protein
MTFVIGGGHGPRNIIVVGVPARLCSGALSSAQPNLGVSVLMKDCEKFGNWLGESDTRAKNLLLCPEIVHLMVQGTVGQISQVKIMSADNESPEAPPDSKGLPEIRLKAGFERPSPSSPSEVQDSPPEPRSQALTIDEMLAISSGHRAQAAQEQPAPQAPPQVKQNSVWPLSAPAPPPPSFPADTSPMTLSNTPSPFGQPKPINSGHHRFRILRDLYETRPRVVQGASAVLILAVIALTAVGILSVLRVPIKLRIESQPSAAKVYLGEELLGQTPLKLELANLDEMPVLKLAGYETTVVPRPQKLKQGKQNIVSATLKGVNFPLDWSGLTDETRIWWEGTEKRPKSTVAGKYKIKVKPGRQSSFVHSIAIPWNNGQAFSIGRALTEEINRRPVVKLSLDGVSKANVIVKDGPRFTHTLTLGKTDSAVTLPGPGTYAVKVKGTNEHGPFEKSIKVKAGDRKTVEVALYQPPPAATHTYQPQRSSYTPRRSHPTATYRPGGNGVGTIAPPAF